MFSDAYSSSPSSTLSLINTSSSSPLPLPLPLPPPPPSVSLSSPCACVVLWTGGKDCCLALHIVSLHWQWRVLSLISLVPEEYEIEGKEFVNHPQSIQKKQAEALNIPIRFVTIRGNIKTASSDKEGKENISYKECYKNALLSVYDEFSMNCIVTGDIGEVGGYKNFISEVCEEINNSSSHSIRSPSPLLCIHPLWGMSVDHQMTLTDLYEIDARISGVNALKLRNIAIGRRFNAQFLEEIRALNQEEGLVDAVIDERGEQGEYHTMTYNARMFLFSIAAS